MGGEDVADRPAATVRSGDDGIGIGGVDGGGVAGLGIMNKHAEIIGAAEKNV
jgi:hypothetical protein